MAKKGIYRGFSTFEFQDKGTFQIFDIETVKLDLLNHIFTRKGTRVMMPTFGTTIPDLVFEPLDDVLVEDIREQLMDVFNFDPRVEVVQLDVVPFFDENALAATVTLRYIELDIVDQLNINLQFEQEL